MEYLGCLLSSIRCGRSFHHRKALVSYPAPTDIKSLKTWLGLAAYFSNHIKDRGLCLSPLYRLLRKNVKFEWGPDEQNSFQVVNSLLTSDKILSFLRFSDRFELHFAAASFQ